nr:hypothetical protein [Tanacetum cinerariifolium]
MRKAEQHSCQIEALGIKHIYVLKGFLRMLDNEVYSTPTPTAMSPSSDIHSQAALAKSAALRFKPTSKEVMNLGLTVF